MCPACREPKRGDNTDTSVCFSVSPGSPRYPSHSRGSSPTYENVTVRAKRPNPVPCSCLSASTIREIIRDELERKFNTAIEDIQIKLATFEKSLALSNSEYTKLHEESASQKAQIVQLQNETKELRDVNRDLTKRLQQVEQQSRVNNLELQCVPEHGNENLFITVQQLGNTIKCPVTETDIQYCSRIAKINAGSPRPRSILVKFSSRRLRDTFLAGVIKFNKNNPRDKLNTSHLGIGGNRRSPVFVTEHLTPETKALHAAARQKARELNYRFVWVRDGKVFLRKTENSNFIVVKDTAVLNNLS